VCGALILCLVGMGCGGGTPLGGSSESGVGGGGAAEDSTEAGPATEAGGITLIPLDAPSAASNTTRLPLSMAPVVDVSSLSSESAMLQSISAKASVSTGIALSGLSDATFSQESSRAACAASQNLHDTIRTAATNDIALCLIQELYKGRESELFVDGTANKKISIDFDAAISGSTGIIVARQLYITGTLDASNRLTNFTMRGCANDVQKLFLTQTMDPSVTDSSKDNFSMTGIVDFSTDSNYQVQTTGYAAFKKDSDGNYIPVFTRKVVETDRASDGKLNGASTAPYIISEGTFTQTSSSRFTLDAYTRFGYVGGVFGTEDYRSFISDGTLVDENAAGDSLLQGVSYEPTYDLAKVGLGTSTSYYLHEKFSDPWHSTTPSDSNLLSRVSADEAWSTTSPFSVTQTFDLPSSRTIPKSAADSPPIPVSGNLFTAEQSWDCVMPSVSEEIITQAMFDRCSKLYLDPANLVCGQIYPHLATVKISGGSTANVFLRTDTTVSFTPTSGITPAFTLTFDGYGGNIENLVSSELITLTKDSTSVGLTQKTAGLITDSNGNYHQAFIEPAQPLSAGTYTLTVGPNIEGSTQKSVFALTIE
jgi:hypothetical protein